MRPSCFDCALKHLSQACVLSLEAVQGYPVHQWYAIGHLAEASDELANGFSDLSNEIRNHRLRYMGDINYAIPFEELINKILSMKLDNKDCCGESERQNKCLSCPNYDPMNEVCTVDSDSDACPLGLWEE